MGIVGGRQTEDAFSVERGDGTSSGNSASVAAGVSGEDGGHSEAALRVAKRKGWRGQWPHWASDRSRAPAPLQ